MEPLRWIISERIERASSAVELSAVKDVVWLQKEMLSSSGPVREDWMLWVSPWSQAPLFNFCFSWCCRERSPSWACVCSSSR